MTTFAQNLSDSINDSKEIARLEREFRIGKTSVETSLSHNTLTELGFVVSSSQRDGTYASLPQKSNSQFADR